MTQEETKQAAEVMIAFANGKIIESAIKGGDGWSVNKNPDWDWDRFDYRIAPDKKKYSVNVHYDYVAHVEVIAENEGDAINKATEIAQNYPLEELEYCDDGDACVTSVEDIG